MIAAATSWTVLGLVSLDSRRQIRQAFGRECALAEQLTSEVKAGDELQRQIDGLNAELAIVLRERDAAVLAHASVLAECKAARQRGEVVIAQAARWKTERDEMQAEIDRMTSGLQHGRKPKSTAPA
jgi:uncharacterized coiled-coil DUF342 family protein